MAKKKRKHSPDAPPKAFRLPPPDDGITSKTQDPSNHIDTLHKLMFQWIDKHPIKNLTRDQNILEQSKRYQAQFKQYVNTLVAHGFETTEQLMAMDQIDISSLTKPLQDNPSWINPIKILELLRQYPEPKTPEEAFYRSLPCFPTGTIRVCDKRYVKFEILSLDLENMTAEIRIADRPITGSERDLGWQIKLTLVCPNSITESTIKNIDIEIDFKKLYTMLTPAELGWNRNDCKFWEAVSLQNAVNMADLYDKTCDVSQDEALALTYLASVELSNCLLSAEKPVLVSSRKPKSGVPAKTKSHTDKPNSPAAIPEKRVRVIGTVKFISQNMPRPASQKTVRQYRLASWTARGHIRHYKSGKTVYIKPQVKRRKALQNNAQKPLQSILKLQDNRPKTEGGN